ncbi:hypothetical protein L6164_003736 [Bauhinia variegata]|uniref:Uncharacterized protein n=1 Tax=Bauhinia variegata TaxID=167791 RepID=A0ACB9Q285_BAUVA|nr:hypothetical protein L6164_003736 [Bauhinia variegata]
MEYLSLLLLVSFFSTTILFFIFLFGSQNSKSAKRPPGPRPFPIIGNILELGSQPHQALANLSKIYGPIMTLKLGTVTTIVISSPELAKQVMHKYDQAFANRTVPDSVRALDHHKLSMAWLAPTSAQWRNLRKASATMVFSSQQLDSTHMLRQRKVQELLNFVEQSCKKGEALDIGEAALTTVLNSISNTLFSMDLAHYTASDKLEEFKEVIWGIMKEAGKPNVVDFFPIFRVLDPQGRRARMTKYFGKLIDFFEGLIEERLHLFESRKESKVCHDVLDSVLELMTQDNSQLSSSHVLHLFLVSVLLPKLYLMQSFM